MPSESGREEMMKVLTNRSKHFMTVEVSATGRSDRGFWAFWGQGQWLSS